METHSRRTGRKDSHRSPPPPAPGSPHSMFAEHLDLGSPRWTPRAPSKEEEIELEKVKTMILAGQLGARIDVETKDIMDTLLSRGGWITGERWRRQ